MGSDGVNGNQLANIHSGEAIFTASQTKGLRQSVLGALSAMARMDKPASVVVMDQGGDALGEQIKGLRSDNALMIEEIKLLRDEQERANFEIAKNTKNSAETLDDWERNGMPQEAV